MRKGGGPAKGSKFERDICKRLSQFVDPSSTEPIFWRSASSGGRATIQNKGGIKNTRQLGDIIPTGTEGAWLAEYFIVECKHNKKLDLENFFIKQTGKLWKFWKKLKKDCKQHERAPLLIARQNNTPTLLITNTSGTNSLSEFGALPPNVSLATISPIGINLIYIYKFEDTFPIKLTKLKRKQRSID